MSASFGTLSIASYAGVVGIPVGIAGSSLTLIFTIGTGLNKSLLRVTKKRKKKHYKIIALAKSKLNMIDTLLSSALNDFKISHKEFTNIITGKKYLREYKRKYKRYSIAEFFRTHGRAQCFSTYGRKINNIIKII